MNSHARSVNNTPPPEELVQQLAGEMPSPYCPGRSISTCSTSAARALEGEMLVLAREGKTREQIEANLVERFGVETMGTPLRTDIVFGATFAAIAVAALLVFRGRAWARRSGIGGSAAGSDPAKTPPISDDEADRLEDALDEIKEF